MQSYCSLWICLYVHNLVCDRYGSLRIAGRGSHSDHSRQNRPWSFRPEKGRLWISCDLSPVLENMHLASHPTRDGKSEERAGQGGNLDETTYLLSALGTGNRRDMDPFHERMTSFHPKFVKQETTANDSSNVFNADEILVQRMATSRGRLASKVAENMDQRAGMSS